jgi:mRNA interferase RelE/StbE
MFKIRFSKNSINFLKKCDNQLYERIMKRIKKLSKEPFSSDSVRIVNKKGKLFRIRVGDYRIIYEIFHDENILVVSNINKRSKAYLK